MDGHGCRNQGIIGNGDQYSSVMEKQVFCGLITDHRRVPDPGRLSCKNFQIEFDNLLHLEPSLLGPPGGLGESPRWSRFNP